MPLVVGLTGGIGAGKTAVAQQFAALKVPVLDTDAIGHDLLRGDPFIAKQVTEYFGLEVLCANGEIDRRRLRQIIFKNPAAKAWLERLLHPRIFAKLDELIRAETAPYVLAEIPLLLETEAQSRVDRILVVDCPESTQISRTVERDHLSEAVIEDIMRHQVNRETRLRAAHDLIENNGSLADLKQQVHDLHLYYLSLSDKK